MKFRVKTKHSPLTLSSVYGTYTFNDGDITDFEPLVRQFSQYFIELPEDVNTEVTADVNTEVVETLPNEEPTTKTKKEKN